MGKNHSMPVENILDGLLTIKLSGQKVSLEWPGNGGIICRAVTARLPNAEEHKLAPSLVGVIISGPGQSQWVFANTKIRLW